MADVVPNSYPKLDLLWDNVMRACGDGPALHSASASPARHPPCDGSGHLRYASRPNPVRRDGDQNQIIFRIVP